MENKNDTFETFEEIAGGTPINSVTIESNNTGTWNINDRGRTVAVANSRTAAENFFSYYTTLGDNSFRRINFFRTALNNDGNPFVDITPTV